MRKTFQADLALNLITWQKSHGRHDLPWQNTRDPYRILVSEIMLQQTQVSAVIPYFRRFMKRFPTLASLAASGADGVLALWSGLGYYARARYLHKASQSIMDKFQGRFPRSVEDIASLPGIGRSTAGAIAVFAFGQREPILDGNVKRVLARYFSISGYPGLPAVAAKLWEKAEQLLPDNHIEAYTQGLMDLGATLCTRGNPECGRCPLNRTCDAHKTGCTHLLPSPKKAKPLPNKKTIMLVAVHDDTVMLVRRPDQGLWGGMMSFPEFPDKRTICAYCRQMGWVVRETADPPVINHTFSHFKLAIRPMIVRIKTGGKPRPQQHAIWFKGNSALRAGIPAPVRKILEDFTPILA